MEQRGTNCAVIFDMDGVLIDSEPLYVEMNEELFSELGVRIDKEEYHKFVGMSSPLMWKMIKDEFSLPQSVDELMNSEKQRIHELLRSDRVSEPIAGVESLLINIANAGIPAAVASSSARKNVEMVLSKLDLSGYFKATVCGEDVANGKPAPDIFLKAATALKGAPENCVVIEDSVNGLRGSHAAGMRCIGYAGDPRSKQDLSGADMLVKSFHEEDRNSIMSFILRRP